MGSAEAKRYLQEHSIPRLFESLMTGLIIHKPEDPVQFMEKALAQIQRDPELATKWEAFVDTSPLADDHQQKQQQEKAGHSSSPQKHKPTAAMTGGKKKLVTGSGGTTAPFQNIPPPAAKRGAGDGGEKGGEKKMMSHTSRITKQDSKGKIAASGGGGEARPRVAESMSPTRPRKISTTTRSKTSGEHRSRASGGGDSPVLGRNGSLGGGDRSMSVAAAGGGPKAMTDAEFAHVPPDVPIVLFIGGPGGGKTRHAAKLAEALADHGLVHICMPDLIKSAIHKYKDQHSEWRLAFEHYQRGELIPNELAQQLIKVEMGKHPYAKIYFLEGFPRDAKQVEDFERDVRPVNMALILDYDEETLRRHMQNRGLLPAVIDRRIDEFKSKTLPSAKYFDDQGLLHLIPGEREDPVILARMQKLVLRAIQAASDGGTAVAGSTAANSAVTSPTTTMEQPPLVQVATAIQHPPTFRGEEAPLINKNANSSAGQQQPQKQQTMSPTPTTITTQPAAVISAAQGHPVSAGGGSPVPAVAPTPPPQQHVVVVDEQQQQQARNGGGSGGGGTSSGPSSARPSVAMSAMATATRVAAASIGSGGRVSAPTAAASAAVAAASAAGLGQLAPPPDSEKGPENGAATSPTRGSTAGGRRSTTEMSPSMTTIERHRAMSIVAKDESAQRTLDDAALGEQPDLFPRGLPNPSAPLILVIGAPGSPKAKIAQKIAAKYENFVHLGMSVLLRRKVGQGIGQPLWHRVNEKMDAGDLVPTKVCREVLYSYVHENCRDAWGYVIEGYPRSIKQVEEIQSQLGRLDLAILVDCTEQFCRHSVQKRWKLAGQRQTERLDDTDEVVLKRLNLFKQNTLPMLKHLDDIGKLRVFEGDKMGEPDGDAATMEAIYGAIDNTVFVRDDGNHRKSIGGDDDEALKVEAAGESRSVTATKRGGPTESGGVAER